MDKSNVNKVKSEAKKHLQRIMELTAQRPSPFQGMSKDEAIEEIRRVREKLWERKLVTRL